MYITLHLIAYMSVSIALLIGLRAIEIRLRNKKINNLQHGDKIIVTIKGKREYGQYLYRLAEDRHRVFVGMELMEIYTSQITFPL